jgi:transcriptional regulatory protein LevR
MKLLNYSGSYIRINDFSSYHYEAGKKLLQKVKKVYSKEYRVANKLVKDLEETFEQN